MAPLFALPIPDEEGQQSKDFLVQSSSYTHASYTPNSSLESADNKMTFLSPDTGAVDIKVTNQNELQTADDSTSQGTIIENDNNNESSLITKHVRKIIKKHITWAIILDWRRLTKSNVVYNRIHLNYNDKHVNEH